jgi:RNA polymerase sigma-70 factor (ECF subfamily)
MITTSTKKTEEKLTKLYYIYANKMWYVAVSYLKDTQIAEDMVQETFVKISKILHNINDLNSKVTKYYLLTILRNTCIDYLRKKNRCKESSYDNTQDDNISSKENLLNEVIVKETLLEIKDIVDKMDDIYKIPFYLKYVQELSNKEIAQKLNISENLVSVRLNRAKNKIKEEIKLNLK